MPIPLPDASREFLAARADGPSSCTAGGGSGALARPGPFAPAMARRNRTRGAAAHRLHLLPLRADRELWRAGLEAGGDPGVRFILHLYGHPMRRLNHTATAILRGVMRDARRGPGFSTLKVDVRPRGAEPAHAAIVESEAPGRTYGLMTVEIAPSLDPDKDTAGVLYVDGWTSPDVPDGTAADWWNWVVDAVLSAAAPLGRLAVESGHQATEARIGEWVKRRTLPPGAAIPALRGRPH